MRTISPVVVLWAAGPAEASRPRRMRRRPMQHRGRAIRPSCQLAFASNRAGGTGAYDLYLATRPR